MCRCIEWLKLHNVVINIISEHTSCVLINCLTFLDYSEVVKP